MSITVIIGAGTTASFSLANDACFISAQWGFNPGRTDAYCLGAWAPSNTHITYKPTQTLSLTMYAPATSSYPIPPSETCDDASTVTASVSPASCDASISDLSGSWFVQSYSYSKEGKDVSGQETWSLIKYGSDVASFLTSQGVSADRIALPSYVIRGITSGEATDEALAGISFMETYAQALNGSVSAGSTGKASFTTYGVVDAVGGGTNSSNFLGTGSASIPYTPLYI